MIEFITGLLTDHLILGGVLSGRREHHRQNAVVLAIDIGSFVKRGPFMRLSMPLLQSSPPCRASWVSMRLACPVSEGMA